MKSEITLSNMEFYGYIGCFEEEKKIGTRFAITLTLQYDASACAKSDDLAHAINYQSVYCKIKEIMREPMNLLEGMAFRIMQELFHQFPQIEHIELSLSKLNPMLAAGGKLAAVTVTLSESNPN